MVNGIAAVGRTILRSGMVSARTLSELENTLAASACAAPRASALFIGGKILLMVGLPGMVWLLMQHWGICGITGTLLPAGAGVIGLLAPDWLIGHQRKRYLRPHRTRPAGRTGYAGDLRPGRASAWVPPIIRVAAELQHAYREIAMEFEKTANELQVHGGQPAWRSSILARAPASIR